MTQSGPSQGTITILNTAFTTAPCRPKPKTLTDAARMLQEHHHGGQRCRLLGVKRTLFRFTAMSAFDPKRTLGDQLHRSISRSRGLRLKRSGRTMTPPCWVHIHQVHTPSKEAR